MTKQQAMEKIQKILAKANDKATPAPEREVALELAKKIAEKNGLKIAEPKAKTTTKRESNEFTFTPKNVYQNQLRVLWFHLMRYAIVNVVKEGKKVVALTIEPRYGCYITEEMVKKMYKEIVKYGDICKAQLKADGWGAREALNLWVTKCSIKGRDEYEAVVSIMNKIICS